MCSNTSSVAFACFLQVSLCHLRMQGCSGFHVQSVTFVYRVQRPYPARIRFFFLWVCGHDNFMNSWQRQHGRNLSWARFATRGCGCPCNAWRVRINVEALAASFAFDESFVVLGCMFVCVLFADSETLGALRCTRSMGVTCEDLVMVHKAA